MDLNLIRQPKNCRYQKVVSLAITPCMMKQLDIRELLCASIDNKNDDDMHTNKSCSGTENITSNKRVCRESSQTTTKIPRVSKRVPSLCHLAELALQDAFVKRCESIALDTRLHHLVEFITPVNMNGELCRIFKRVPAVS